MIVYEKQCDCVAGASGPRFVTVPISTPHLVYRTTWVQFACDECDREWFRHAERLALPSGRPLDSAHD